MPALMDGLMAVAAKNDFNQSKLKPPGPVGEECMKWIDEICGAIGDAHEKWRMGSTIVGVLIHGNLAFGGQLAGLPLEPFILAKAPRKGMSDKALPYAMAAAKGISKLWDDVLASFKVPGAPWYPTFQQVNGPVAPPTPNIPWPLATCLPGMGLLVGPLIKEKMLAALTPKTDLAAELFESVAKGFATYATNWVKGQDITNVLGTGPTTGWAPPLHPIGQVAGGHTIPGPGLLV